MKLQFPGKVQVVAPVEADRFIVEKLEIDFMSQTCKGVVQLIDSDGQGPGLPCIVDRKAVTMGLSVLKTDTKNLKKEFLETIVQSEILPAGGIIEDEENTQ